MFTKIKNWLLGIEHSVESIVSDITGTVKKLESHADDMWRKVTHQQAVKAAAEVAITTAAREASKAETVANKLGALVS